MPDPAEVLSDERVRIYPYFAITDSEEMVDAIQKLGGTVWARFHMSRDSDKIWTDLTIPVKHREIVDEVVKQRIASGQLVQAKHLVVDRENVTVPPDAAVGESGPTDSRQEQDWAKQVPASSPTPFIPERVEDWGSFPDEL